jgi:hypothetical protein
MESNKHNCKFKKTVLSRNDEQPSIHVLLDET